VVAGGIARRIRFRFHDAPADAAAGKFVHDDFADQKTREFDGVAGQFGAGQAADANFLTGM
jgi:hypothetical protein